MEIIIKGEPKEIAALVREVQGRQKQEGVLELDGKTLGHMSADVIAQKMRRIIRGTKP